MFYSLLYSYFKLISFKYTMSHQIIRPPQWRRGRAFSSHAKDRGSIPGRDRRKSLKQVVTDSLPNAPQQKVGPCRSMYGTSNIPHCYEWQANVKICSPSSSMVTSSNEWKFLEWDENTKQTNHTIQKYAMS